jgi:hypothetical protein
VGCDSQRCRNGRGSVRGSIRRGTRSPDPMVVLCPFFSFVVFLSLFFIHTSSMRNAKYCMYIALHYICRLPFFSLPFFFIFPVRHDSTLDSMAWAAERTAFSSETYPTRPVYGCGCFGGALGVRGMITVLEEVGGYIDACLGYVG